MSQNNNYLYAEHTWQDRDEEYTSLALLTEKHDNEEQEEVNSLGAVPMDFSCSYTHPASVAMQTSQPNGEMMAVDDSHDTYDFYIGLGMLLDVHSYNLLLCSLRMVNYATTAKAAESCFCSCGTNLILWDP